MMWSQRRCVYYAWLQVLRHSKDVSDCIPQGRFDYADSIASLMAMPRLHQAVR